MIPSEPEATVKLKHARQRRRERELRRNQDPSLKGRPKDLKKNPEEPPEAPDAAASGRGRMN